MDYTKEDARVMNLILKAEGVADQRSGVIPVDLVTPNKTQRATVLNVLKKAGDAVDIKVGPGNLNTLAGAPGLVGRFARMIGGKSEPAKKSPLKTAPKAPIKTAKNVDPKTAKNVDPKTAKNVEPRTSKVGQVASSKAPTPRKKPTEKKPAPTPRNRPTENTSGAKPKIKVTNVDHRKKGLVTETKNKKKGSSFFGRDFNYAGDEDRGD